MLLLTAFRRDGQELPSSVLRNNLETEIADEAAKVPSNVLRYSLEKEIADEAAKVQQYGPKWGTAFVPPTLPALRVGAPPSVGAPPPRDALAFAFAHPSPLVVLGPQAGRLGVLVVTPPLGASVDRYSHTSAPAALSVVELARRSFCQAAPALGGECPVYTDFDNSFIQ